MSRKRKGIPIHGWIALDKPLGISSAQAVAAIKRATNAAKIGHGGTLDPLASGVLPIALGEATKTVQYVMDGTKTYRWHLSFGEARSTDDREGEVVETCAHRPSAAEIEAALPAFTGEVVQVPPAFSAIKVAGERAYELARAGEAVELQPRTVRIERFTLVDMPDQDTAVLETVCGKGTYIRSLARDLARAVGTCGHVAVLRRTACGPFHEADAISLDKISELGQGAALRSHLLPIVTALDDIPALALSDADARRLHSGSPVSLLRAASRTPLAYIDAGQTVRAMQGSRLVALARIENGEIRPVRVFNLNDDDKESPDVDHA
ncbi:MAG: tRNA pseudouridine(55) synthase TruB [Actinomycetota bacterium]